MWSRQRFINNGMPSQEIPENKEVKGSFSQTGLEKLLEERLALGPLSAWEQQTYDNIFEWTLHGVPDTAKPIKPSKGRHRLTSQELQLSLDKICRFIDKGYVFGPFNPEQCGLEATHSISTFIRYQKVR